MKTWIAISGAKCWCGREGRNLRVGFHWQPWWRMWRLGPLFLSADDRMVIRCAQGHVTRLVIRAEQLTEEAGLAPDDPGSSGTGTGTGTGG